MKKTERRHQKEEESDDDDMPVLSAHALAALNEFLAEKDLSKKSAPPDAVDEDWQLSQFWYTDETSQMLAEEALEQVGPQGGCIGCISTPSAFKALNRLAEQKDPRTKNAKVVLFEYDRRFGTTYPDHFEYYDFNNPLSFGNSSDNTEKYKGFFDVLLIDPPFLSEDCMSEFLKTVRHLSKPTTRLLIMTGRIMEDYVLRQDATSVGGTGMRLCQWQPQHSNKLSNEFCCFTNYASTRLRSTSP